VNEPLQIASATATLSNHIVNVGSFSGAAFGSDPAIAGSASFPVHCTAPETCIVQFNLHSDELSLARINQLLNPAARSQPWYRLLAIGQQHDDALLKLRAGGKFNVARLQFGPLPASNVAGEIQMNAGKVRLDVLRSDLLGGHHNGRWTADFTQSPPRFAGGGTLQKIAMDQLSALMHDNWAAGQISGKFRINMQGANAASLRNSLAGSLDFVWTGGSLRHVTLEGRSSPLTFASLAGVLEARQGKLLFNDCKMKTAGLDYTLTGTAAYDRSLDLHLQREGGPSYAIAGPLDKPRVEALPSTSAQAHLR